MAWRKQSGVFGRPAVRLFHNQSQFFAYVLPCACSVREGGGRYVGTGPAELGSGLSIGVSDSRNSLSGPMLGLLKAETYARTSCCRRGWRLRRFAAGTRAGGGPCPHHIDRSSQSSPFPAIALSGCDDCAGDIRDRVADPSSLPRSQGGHDAACRGDRRGSGGPDRASQHR